MRLVLSAISIIVLFNVHSQSEKTSVGMHVGYALSNDNILNDNYKYIAAFNSGIEFRFRLGESGFFIQTGLRVNEFGSKYKGEVCQSQSGIYSICEPLVRREGFYCLSLPIIATYKFKNKLPGLTLSAGPQLSTFVSSTLVKNNKPKYLNFNKPDFCIGSYFSIGYEKSLSDQWMLGTEVFSNFTIPVGNLNNLEGMHNFGLAITGRYIFKG